MKILTTMNKKIFASAGLVITAWHVLLAGGNPFNLAALPSFVSVPFLGGFSLLHLAGIMTALTVYMVWTEY